MDKATNVPIAQSTRSKKPTSQQSSSNETTSTENKESKEDFSKSNINKEEDSLQIVENNMTQVDNDDIHSSSWEEKEVKNEQPNDHTYSNLQFQQLQASFAAEIAQKQKIIENQEQLLLQLQSNIQELIDTKNHNQPTQSIINNNFHPNSNLTSPTRMEPSTTLNQTINNISKYDNFIEQQVLKDKISNIRKFSGNKHEDVMEWLENIEHDFSSTLVSEEIKLKLIPKSLKNDAEGWFEQNKHRLVSWKIFKVEIQQRFQSSLHRDEKFMRLRERKQQIKETGQQFVDVMEKLCFQVNSLMTEQEKMLHIKAGLKPSLKEKVLDKQPQSMQELRNTIKRIEDIETMLNEGNNNEYQVEQESQSSNPEQSSFSANVLEPLSNDSNCYALPPHSNGMHYRRNKRPWQHHQQQRYGSNQNYQTRSQNNQPRNHYQSNYQTQSNSYLPPPPSNNYPKKY